jgi:ubiquinone/menaquinone biosynthesis C-methylase UbiE
MKASSRHKANSIEQWDAYWAQGNITSLASAYEGTYEGDIRAFWQRTTQDLPDGARIVDLGTGNAALPILLHAWAREQGKNWDLTGVDLAHVDKAIIRDKHPEFAEALDDITLLGRTSMTRLPMPDATVDCVTGQFAIEYAPMQEVLKEVSRVLKPGAMAAFMVHHPQSVIIRTSREEKEQARLVFDEHKVLLRAKSLIKAMGDARTPEALARLRQHPETERKRHLLNQALSALQQSGPWQTSAAFIETTLSYVAALFDDYASAPLREKLALLQQARHELATNLERIDDLLAAQKSEEDMLAMVGFAERHGLQTNRMEPFVDSQDRLIGWSWLLVRTPA